MTERPGETLDHPAVQGGMRRAQDHLVAGIVLGQAPAAERDWVRRGWLWLAVLACVVALGGVSTATFVLRSRSEAAREVEWLLTRLEVEAQTINALEWELVARPEGAPALETRLTESYNEIEATIALLEERAGSEPRVAEVIDTYVAYEDELAAQLELIYDGRFKAAAAVDRNIVDPALEEFVGLLTTAADEQRMAAIDASEFAFYATNGLVLALVVMGAALFFGAQRHRTRLAMACGEREALARIADHDPLTGIYNRRRFEAEAATALASGAAGSLLFIDIDRFKAVNDQFGHAAGDDLLRGIAQAIRASVRSGDVVARVGGDEFAVLIRDGSEELAEDITDRICAAVRERAGTYPCAGGSPSASIGVAAFAGGGEQVAALLARADAAMYVAKRHDARHQAGRAA